MKRNCKRILAALIAFALFCALGGCRGGSVALRVTLVLKTTVETAEFWELVMDGVNTAATEFGVVLTVTGASAETEIDEQIAVMEDVILDKPDVIILIASDYDRMVPVTEKAVDAGIRVVTMDSDVNTDSRSCYVASDNYQIGRSLGAQMLDALPAGQVAILTHSTTASSGIDRARGATDAMKKNKDIEVIGVYNCHNDMEAAVGIAAGLMQKYPDLAGFICTNEVCNLAVAGSLANLEKAGEVVVIGCDNSQQQIQYLEQNVIQGIVIQRPFTMGYMAVQQAVKVGKSETVPTFVEVSCVSITRSNMYNSDNQKLLFPF